MKKALTAFDEKEGYCRLLGHYLCFSYCRSCRDGYPCHKILDCWFEKFDVRHFIDDNFTAEEIEQFSAPPKPKIQTLVTLIQEAQKRIKNRKTETQQEKNLENPRNV